MKGKEGGERGIRRRKEIEREGSKRNEMEGKGIRKGKQGEERRRRRRRRRVKREKRRKKK